MAEGHGANDDREALDLLVRGFMVSRMHRRGCAHLAAMAWTS